MQSSGEPQNQSMVPYDIQPDNYAISYDNFSFDYLDNFPYELQVDEAEIFLDLSALNIFLIVLYGLIFIIGLLGNLFVIFVIIRFKSMRTLTNYFLVNLTCGDILVIVICIPVTLGSTVYKKWIYGEILCKLTPFIQGIAVGVSVLSLLFISISRYFAIYKPLTAKIAFSTKNVRIMICVIWIISLGSFSPLLFVNSVKTSNLFGLLESKICEEQWNSQSDKNVFNLFVFSVLFVCPFIIMLVAYSVIGYTLWYGNPTLRDACKMHQLKTNLILKQRRRTVKMLICVVICFGICWLPYYIVNLWIDFNIGDTSKTRLMTTVYTYIYPLVMILGLSNSAINPICYCFLSRGFRRGLRQLLYCNGFLKRSSVFFKSSFKLKSTVSESFDTANV
ncbi:QRFP-like peptide receptor [Ruditapes philippinarum]|uniref:QRFP-like peptide receptor n=1 Tax=Ruditapes philippinarum TaxID=129788 RepID=UPI00295C28C6|nr:QRFP-like peptide receptor [Ruditapes philippinarum]